jgi:protein-L-isoaspartate(D-aspartate) O-methyltransferase
MTAPAPTLEDTRRAFAEELRHVGHVRSDAVLRAFARVPRERFLGPGPWKLYQVAEGYWTTDDADPRRLYHDVVVAIDAERRLNNGQPSLWARLFDRLHIAPGDRVVQIGAGTGYYTAILAEMVGPSGSVWAWEVDADLAARAAAALADWPQAAVHHGNGQSPLDVRADAIIAFCGATHPLDAWLDGLAEGGRLLLPLTTERRGGFACRILRHGGGYTASALGAIGIYDCAGARDADAGERLGAALAAEWPAGNMGFRRDAHDRGAQCWLHGKGYCFSRPLPLQGMGER